MRQGGVALPRGGGETVVAAATGTSGEPAGEPPVNLIILGRADSQLAARAKKLGFDAVIASEITIEAAIALALKRLDELQVLREINERTVLVERAKGILMERHQLTADAALAILRRHARNANLKLVDVASAVTASHLLLAERA